MLVVSLRVAISGDGCLCFIAALLLFPVLLDHAISALQPQYRVSQPQSIEQQKQYYFQTRNIHVPPLY